MGGSIINIVRRVTGGAPIVSGVDPPAVQGTPPNENRTRRDVVSEIDGVPRPVLGSALTHRDQNIDTRASHRGISTSQHVHPHLPPHAALRAQSPPSSGGSEMQFPPPPPPLSPTLREGGRVALASNWRRDNVAKSDPRSGGADPGARLLEVSWSHSDPSDPAGRDCSLAARLDGLPDPELYRLIAPLLQRRPALRASILAERSCQVVHASPPEKPSPPLFNAPYSESEPVMVWSNSEQRWREGEILHVAAVSTGRIPEGSVEVGFGGARKWVAPGDV